jgi:hypothetical protein
MDKCFVTWILKIGDLLFWQQDKSECLDSVLEIVLLNAKSLLQRNPSVSTEAGIVVAVFPYNEDTVILLGILSVMQGIVVSVLQYISVGLQGLSSLMQLFMVVALLCNSQGASGRGCSNLSPEII